MTLRGVKPGSKSMNATYDVLARALFGSLAVVWGLVAVAMGDPPVVRAPTVADLAAAKAGRVAGGAAQGSVLDAGGADGWCDNYVWGPTVLFHGDIYPMWFAGGTTTKDLGVPYGIYERIGLATSRDGLNWELANDGRPVLDLGPAGSFDDTGLAHPFVMRVGDEYRMWYGGIDGRAARHLGLLPSHVRIEQIGLATSKDGIHWQRSTKPVMEIGPSGSIDSIQATGMHVLRKNDEYWIWYGGEDSSPPHLQRIGLMTLTLEKQVCSEIDEGQVTVHTPM